MGQLKGRYACVEINKNLEDNIEYLKSLDYNYLIIGGYEDGGYHLYDPKRFEENKHIHAFIDFGKQVGQTRMRNKIKGQGDWATATYGTTDDCRDYCIKLEKEETLTIDNRKIKYLAKVKEPYGNNPIIFEDGEFESLEIGRGKRNDLKKLLEENKFNPKAIKDNDPEAYTRYRNGILDICKDYQDDKEMLDWLGLEKEGNSYKDKEYQPTVVHWFYGSTGTGKTFDVKKTIREAVKAQIKSIRTTSRIDKFANNFALGVIREETETLIIDEFRGSRMALADLLQLIDGCKVNIKGGDRYIHAKEVYITSCQHPEEAYHSVKSDDVKQLMRRITDLKKFGDDKQEEDDIFNDDY